MPAHGSFDTSGRTAIDQYVKDITRDYSQWGNLLVALRVKFPDIQDLWLSGQPAPVGEVRFIFNDHETVGMAMDQVEIMVLREIEEVITKHRVPKTEEEA